MGGGVEADSGLLYKELTKNGPTDPYIPSIDQKVTALDILKGKYQSRDYLGDTNYYRHRKIIE